jgi:hypothetical protein
MRGRKKKEDSKTKVLSIRITEEQHELLSKNEWLKKEILKQLEEHLNVYLIK